MSAKPDALERVLLAQVDAALRRSEGSAAGDARVVAALRAELAREGEEAQETLAFGARMAQLLPGESPSDARLGVRFERAIAAALAAAGAPDGEATLAPRVVVLRDDAGGDTRRHGTLSSLGQTLSREARPALVLAGTQARAALADAGGTLESGAAKIVALPALPKPLARLAAAPAPRTATLGAGDWIGGKYRIVREIGRGGFGAVFEARDETLGSRVAVKVMNARAACTPAEVQEFKNEARRVTRLSHPNIVDWKTFDELPDGSSFFVMEFLEGEDLESVLKREQRLEPRRAMEIVLQVLDALRAAHHLSATEAILHLDLKPRNVFLVKGPGGAERVKVIDFGIGQYVGGDEAPVAAAGAGAGGAGSATSTLRAMPVEGSGSAGSASSGGVHRSSSCTPEYASPEQCAHLLPGQEIVALDGRSDLYSLGVMAFQMVTGELPFAAPKRRMDWLKVHLEQSPRRLAEMRTKAPRAFCRFVDRCLMRERDARFATTAAAFEELQRIVHPPLVRHLAWAAPLLAAAIGAIWFGWRRSEELALAKARFPMVETASGAQARGRTHYFGPARASAAFRAADLELDERARLVLQDAQRDEVAGFAAGIGAAGEIVVRASGASGERRAVGASVRVAEGGDQGRLSEPFDLVWIGESAWSVASIDVPGLAGRSLDPRGQSLVVEIEGPAAGDLAAVRVRAGEREVEAVPGEARDGHARFSAPLAELALEGSVQLQVEAVDRAGRSVAAAWPAEGALVLVDGPLSAAAGPEFSAIRGRERFFVSPSTEPRLRATLARPAALALEVLDLDGKRLRDWSFPAATSFDVDLQAMKSIAGGRPYSGQLRARLDEGAFVARAAGREHEGVVEATFDFEYSLDEPAFSASCDDGRGRELLAADGVVWSRSGEAVLRVRRGNQVPARVALTQRRPDGNEQSLLDAALSGGADLERSALVALAEEGVHEVRLQAWRADAAGPAAAGPAPADAELDWRARIVVDRSAPVVRLSGEARGAVVRRLDQSLAPVEVTLEDAPIGGHLTPARIDWRLEHLRGAIGGEPQVDVVRAGSLPQRLVAGATASIELPGAWGERGERADGTWRFVVIAHDAAGNPPAEGSVEFAVSLAGPGLSLVRPGRIGDFTAASRGDGATEGWFAEVRAADENGVAEVRARARLAGAAAGARAIPFELEGEVAGRESVWSGWLAEDFPFTWSGREVEIEIEAIDREGSAAPVLVERRRLPMLERAIPQRIAGGRGVGDLASLRRVRGNRATRFVFGGQVEAEENRLFLAAGLPPFARDDAPPRSWQQAIEPGAIADLYVDETEVTNGQYLRFLADPAGWPAADWWRDGREAGDAERAAALVERLAAAPADEPVTGIDWHEAAAFAAWTGKRLPTLLEWEWIVRGPEFRPWSGQRPDEAIDAARARFATLRAGAPRPVGAEPAHDVSPDGVRDLCSNVAEWCADGPAGPDADPDERWLAGGSYAASAFDFSKVEAAWLDARRATTGLRCVIDASAALASMEGDGPEPFRAAPAGDSR